MQLPSPEVFASWPTPNYVNPESRGDGVLIVDAIFFPLALIVIILRIYTRIRISKSFGLDDWLIVAAMFPATAFAVAALLAETTLGWNRHIWDVPYSRITFGLQFVMITQIIFTLAQTLTKCSMLALIYRIMSNGKAFKRATIAAVVLIAGQGMIFIIVVIFQCRPPSHYWLLTFQPQPECINQSVHVTFAGAINTLTDCLVVLFPVPTMLKLQIPRRQRLIVILLFAAGLLVCVAGAVRTYYTWLEITNWDATWNTYYVWFTSCIELYVGIIGASIPATKPFFKRYLPRLLDSTLISSRSTAAYAISDADKGPFSASVTNTSSSRPPSHMHGDLELGTISLAAHAARRTSRTLGLDLEAIEEVGGLDRVSETSISSFVDVGSGDGTSSGIRVGIESESGTDTGTGTGIHEETAEGTRGRRSLRSIELDTRSGSSEEDLIEEMDVVGVAPWRMSPLNYLHPYPSTR